MRWMRLAALLLLAAGIARAGEPVREVGPPPEVQGLYGDYHWALEVDGARVAWFKTVEGLHVRVSINEDEQLQQEARLVPVEGQDPLFGPLVLGGGVSSPEVAAWLSGGLPPGRRSMRLVPWLHDATPTLAAGRQCAVSLGRGAITEVRLEAEWKGRHRLGMTLVGDGAAITDDCQRLRAEPAERSAPAKAEQQQPEQ